MRLLSKIQVLGKPKGEGRANCSAHGLPGARHDCGEGHPLPAVVLTVLRFRLFERGVSASRVCPEPGSRRGAEQLPIKLG